MVSIAKNFQSSSQSVDSFKQWAHDIKSPLLCLDVLSKQCDELAPQKQQLLRTTIDMVRSMTTDLLTQFNQQRQSPFEDPTSNSIATVLDRVVSMKWLEISNRPGISIEVRHGAGVRDASAQIDSQQLARLLSNLINNSVEAIPDTGVVSLSLATTHAEILLLIEDTGHGIPKDVVELINRGAHVSLGKNDGQGLGLTHARREIERAGGSLEVMSRPQQGTCVKVRLPRLSN